MEDSLAGETPDETGLAVAVYLEGRPVVDLWGGLAHADRGIPWQRDTVNCLFSCTKGVMSMLAAVLVDSGALDYDTPVCSYWPDFGAGGKAPLTVAQLLSHQAGLPLFENTVGDWRLAAEELAAAKPRWLPGSRHGYHALTWGNLVGYLFETASGTPLDELLARRLCRVAGADIRLGPSLLPDQPPATLCGGPTLQVDEASLLAVGPSAQAQLLVPAIVNSTPWRDRTWPGAGGYGTARDLARLYNAFIDPLHPLVQPHTLAAATRVRCVGKDATLGLETAYAAGFQRPSTDITPGHPGRTATWGHRGMYGSTGFADPEASLAFAYTMNRCGNPMGDERLSRLTTVLYACL